MRFKQVGDKADAVAVVIKNAESATTIARGRPVILSNSGTDDGLAVVLPATAQAAKSNALFYGVAAQDLAVGSVGDSTIFGVAPYAIIQRATRAASSDNWSASASIAALAMLCVDTVNNAFHSFSSAAASADVLGFAVLLESLAAVVSTAASDATADTRTALTVAKRVFVRAL